MGASTKNVGGGQATPLANDFNNFLRNGLTTGTFGSVPQGQQRPRSISEMFRSLGAERFNGPGGANPASAPGSLSNTIGQTQGIGGAINTQLQGGLGDYGSLNNTKGILGDMGAFTQGVANGGVPQIDMSAIMQAFQGLGNATGALGSPSNTLNTNNSINPVSAGSADANGTFGTAVQGVLDRQLQRNIADLRARFGASGGTSMGTPAGSAEALLRAEALPQMAAALGNINLQERGLNLQEGQINQAGQIAQAELNQQGALGNINAQLQAMGLDAQTANMISSTMLQGQGMNMNAQQNQQQITGNLFNSLFGNQLASDQLGLQTLNSQNANQQQVMNNLFQMFGQANQLGTAQAQTVQTPGMGQQLLGAATGVMGMLNPMAQAAGGFGSLFGGGGIPSIPQINIPNIQMPQVNVGYQGWRT
jgi:hypothetical protein